GELAELERRLDDHLEEARRRGDLYAEVNFATGYGNAVWLARDQPEAGRAELRAAIARWSRSGLHVQHWYAMRGEALIALYTGDTGAGRDCLQRLPAVRRSLLRHNRAVRAE